MEVSTQLLTVPEAARILGLGRSLMYQLVLRGDIASLKIGRARRIPVSAVEAFIREQLEASSGGGYSATTGQGELTRQHRTHRTQQLEQAAQQQQLTDNGTSKDDAYGHAA